MTDKRTMLLIAVALGLLAGGQRFFRLGAWPFSGDELMTIEEADSLAGLREFDPDSQVYRLPRLIPLSYGAQSIGYQLFGRDELGSRVLPAILGSIHVMLVFLFLEGLLGRPSALATGLLLAVWPEHVFQSQQNRFYMTAFFCASLCLLAGAWALQRRSLAWTLLACLAALAAILAHTLLALLLGGLVVALLTGTLARRQPMPWSMLALVLVTALGAAVFFMVYLAPLMRDWNRGGGWGYSPAHGVLAALNQVGWPIVLLAAVGAAGVFGQRDGQGWYWLTWAGLWASAALVLPLVVVFHPSYLFPFALGVLVLAGRATGQIYDFVRTRSGLAAWTWMAAVCGFNLPSLASHFQDGSRHDFRTPAQYIESHWRPGDHIMAASNVLLGHYADVCRSAIPLAAWDPLPDLQGLEGKPGRVWIVLPSDRGGKPEDLRKWLGTRCAQELEVRRKRFDYRDFIVEVFLYTPTR